jgi:hypothetical protein
MGTLKSDVLAQPVGKSGRKPMVEKIIKTLNKEDRLELIEILDDPTISGRAICKVLNDRGIEISEATLYRYRTTGAYRDIA